MEPRLGANVEALKFIYLSVERLEFAQLLHCGVSNFSAINSDCIANISFKCVLYYILHTVSVQAMTNPSIQERCFKLYIMKGCVFLQCSDSLTVV